MKRSIALGLGLAMAFLLTAPAHAAPVQVSAPSAILMEKTTGKVLYEQDAQVQYEPASVTKVMTLLLVMEAIDSGKIALTDQVTCSDVAAGYGGSQIWLKPGETMTVDELLKAAAIASANDATVCLAEYIAGSEEAFVQLLNKCVSLVTNGTRLEGVDS